MNIGVYGSAAGDTDGSIGKLARRVGAEIAKRGHTVVTGACIGIPQEAVLGAKSVGGSAISFSSSVSKKQHIARGEPIEGFSKIYYVPKNFKHADNLKVCQKYRNITSVVFVDAAIFINGRM